MYNIDFPSLLSPRSQQQRQEQQQIILPARLINTNTNNNNIMPIIQSTAEEPLVTGADALADPIINPPKFLEVIAPMSLNEGYTLNVIKDGQELTVLVPDGGVKEGERFTGHIESALEFIPQGRWRDGTFNCCAYGLCHPMFCYACCCHPLVLGQVMTRMSLNLLCQKGKPPLISRTFFWMALIWITDQVVENIMHFILRRDLFVTYGTSEYDMANLDNGAQLDPFVVYMFGILAVMAAIRFWWIVLSTTMTRMTIRDKYKIPGNCCADFCCSCLCTPCTICHMARHTYDYRKYPIQCFSESCLCSNTGSSPDAPLIV